MRARLVFATVATSSLIPKTTGAPRNGWADQLAPFYPTKEGRDALPHKLDTVIKQAEEFNKKVEQSEETARKEHSNILRLAKTHLPPNSPDLSARIDAITPEALANEVKELLHSDGLRAVLTQSRAISGIEPPNHRPETLAKTITGYMALSKLSHIFPDLYVSTSTEIPMRVANPKMVKKIWHATIRNITFNIENALDDNHNLGTRIVGLGSGYSKDVVDRFITERKDPTGLRGGKIMIPCQNTNRPTPYSSMFYRDPAVNQSPDTMEAKDHEQTVWCAIVDEIITSSGLQLHTEL